MEDLDVLARRACQGDATALAAFVRRTQQDVWRLCSYLGSPDTADDLAQETYLRALRALEKSGTDVTFEFTGDFELESHTTEQVLLELTVTD